MITSILSAMAALFGGEAPMQSQENAPVMEITRKTDQTAIDGPAEWFTGRVTISSQFQRTASDCDRNKHPAHRAARTGQRAVPAAGS